ncbi:hypothetical protein ABZ891_31070 [Streptomyces sp. NPDC047023]|uniref:hypothetical protein n=1 Tax=Streptomyces sp. NPDC047023 TaxID=3155139 RepID=UPI0033E322D3
MVHAAGIAARGDEHACRWVAVRHASDHIHIAATLARQDGRHPRVRGDIPNMHTAARAFEARWGLAEMSPLDRTARRRPLTGEAEKAARRGLAETARESLQRTVRTAAALAHDDTDFLDRLRDAGLRVHERRDDDGTLVGYAVALPGDRERFEPAVTPADGALAEHRIREASAVLGRAGQADGAGDVAALLTSWPWLPSTLQAWSVTASARRPTPSSRPPAPPAPARWRAVPAPDGGPPPAHWSTPRAPAAGEAPRSSSPC